jgi:hypothetical protein
MQPRTNFDDLFKCISLLFVYFLSNHFISSILKLNKRKTKTKTKTKTLLIIFVIKWNEEKKYVCFFLEQKQKAMSLDIYCEMVGRVMSLYYKCLGPAVMLYTSIIEVLLGLH